MDAHPAYLRARLSLMMFFEFFIWGAWWVPVTSYVRLSGLQFTEVQAGWIFATIPFGAIISPLFVGFIADRFLPTQWVIGALHVVGGLCLILAGIQQEFWLMMLVLMLNTVCFMPTLALCNSLAFRHLDDPHQFPRIAMFGSIGWIVAGLAVGALAWETKGYFFYLAGVVSLVQAGYCLTALPHTPPKGRGEGSKDVFGLEALKLLRNSSFLNFVVCAFLVVIPTMYYFFGCNLMLVEHEWPAPTAVMTIAQVSEVCVMFALPAIIAAVGLRNVLSLGMLAWALRYVLFATGAFPLVLLALVIHGFAYCFVYVGSYIFVDKWAPRHLRASAQSLIAFLMLGMGMFLGSHAAGVTLGQYPGVVSQIAATKETKDGPVVDASAPIPSWNQLAVLDKNGDGKIDRKEVGAVEDAGLPVGGFTYSEKELERVLLAADDLKEVRTRGDFRSAVAGDIAVTRPDWIRATVHRWGPYWLWPGLAAAVIGIFYWISSSGTPEPQQEAGPEPPPTGKTESPPPPASAPPSLAEPI